MKEKSKLYTAITCNKKKQITKNRKHIVEILVQVVFCMSQLLEKLKII